MTPNPQLLERGYAICERLTRQYGTTYYWGARLLPQAPRLDVYALYGLARSADDLVDVDSGAQSPTDALADFEGSFWAALAEPSTDPMLAAIAHTVHRTGLPHEYFSRFFAAMRTDLHKATYETWDDLLGYMDGSAAVIGEMMMPVLGAPADALPAARALGNAFQLTNFLRDVAEDLDRGRVYLPQVDLQAFGADPWARTVDEPWREFMRFQLARNRRLYREADPGIEVLSGAAQRCVATARVLYARILERIEAVDYDVFAGRVRVSTAAKSALAARMVTTRSPMALVRADRAAADPHAGSWVSDDQVVLLHPDGSASGTALKSDVHHDDTAEHLAFSAYIFDAEGRVLVTRRATTKPSFPGMVTNSACGHPKPGESLVAALRRRVSSELGLEVDDPVLILPGFRYRAYAGTIVENEACPVFAVFTDDEPAPDPAEVESFGWVPWATFRDDVLCGRRTVSPWCAEQVAALADLGDDPRTWEPGDPEDLPKAARAASPTVRV